MIYIEPSGAAVRRFERSLQNNIYYVKGSGSSHMALYLVFIDCSSAKGIQFNCGRMPRKQVEMIILLDHCEERQREAMVTFVLG